MFCYDEYFRFVQAFSNGTTVVLGIFLPEYISHPVEWWQLVKYSSWLCKRAWKSRDRVVTVLFTWKENKICRVKNWTKGVRVYQIAPTKQIRSCANWINCHLLLIQCYHRRKPTLNLQVSVLDSSSCSTHLLLIQCYYRRKRKLN